MLRFAVVAGLAACAGLAAVVAADGPGALDPSRITAGPLTADVTGPGAFSVPAVTLTKSQMKVFADGKSQFLEEWVVAPDPGVWGLGPTFNEDRCAHCHVENGRSRAPFDGGLAELGMLLRVSVAGTTSNGAPLPHPDYGDQIQNRGVPGRVPAEGDVRIDYETVEVRYADGERAELRRPKVRFESLAFGPIGPETLMSLRAAPAMVGLGMLEAVPEATIVALAEAQKAVGFRGKPNYVWDVENEQRVLGRFGWKANQPSLRQQTAAAFHGDIGATTFLFPEENCPPVQKACLELPSASKCGGQGGCTGNQFRPEVIPSRLSNITLYLQALAVPAQRPLDPATAERGATLFAQAQCAVCHVPELKTGKAALPAASNVTIRPYTDLLLHDMGEGLADGRPDFEADGRQWRTAPLWGIGLLPQVNKHMDLLHDGRARGVAEAILWHGGEAEGAREAFRKMSRQDRETLVRFVESL